MTPAPAADSARPLPVAIAFDVIAAAGARAEGIAARQHARLAALLAAAARTRRYRHLLGRRGVASVPLQALPVATKAELMADYEAHVSDPRITLAALRRFCADTGCIGERFLDRYWVWESSGSSGTPGLYVQDEIAMAVYDALEGTRRHSPRAWLRLLDPLYLSERFAFVGATSGHFASFVSVQRLRRANPLLAHWRSFSILQPTAELAAALDAYRPTLIATYPTAAHLLATEAAAGRLHARPQEIWTGGETLTPTMRHAIEQAFGAPVRNSYGASEFLPIAWECSHGRLHVNADWVILEPVDERHRPVPPGVTSHTTLLTNLANHVLPLIRFDIGDSICLGGARCGCDSALPVVQVQGRCDDALVVPGRDGHHAVTLLPLALSTVLEEQAGVFDFRVRQTAPGVLHLALGPGAAPDAATARRCAHVVAAFARAHGAAPLHVRTQRMAAIGPAPSGKVKRIVALPTARQAAQPGARRGSGRCSAKP